MIDDDPSELAARVDRYCACWRVMEEAERLDRLRDLLAPDVRYVDPRTDVTGIEALAAHIGAVAAARPSARIERTTPLDTHHDVARFGWHLVDGGERRLAGSIDVVRFARGTMLVRTILGFFGPLGADEGR